MARKTIVTLVDDLTGEAAEDISTVEFAVDGMTYELDLTDENSAKLRGTLSPVYQSRSKNRRSTPRPNHQEQRQHRRLQPRNAEIDRAWAKQNGHRVSDRGRLSAEILQAWQSAQAGMSHA